MKSNLQILGSLSLLSGSVRAFWGQVSITESCGGEGGCLLGIGLLDYNTGSTYNTGYYPCIFTTGCQTYFVETSPGGYDFPAWADYDGECIDIDFEGALSSGDGQCCGLPCDLSA
ncbi:hypothetical protein BX600DRAFT_553436 [Xylariales sp. PMI_506]|nr:hypothetical protein BX600DRAFT_553436 [Xylariales sp. PMI_506]